MFPQRGIHLLHSVVNDTALRESCTCHVTESLERITVSSASEEENKAPTMWVSNSAYALSCSDQKVVLSRRGWLNDNIISAAQMMLLQFFPNMAGLQPPTLQKGFCISCPLWRICSDHSCQKQHLGCCVHSWLSEWCCPRV